MIRGNACPDELAVTRSEHLPGGGLSACRSAGRVSWHGLVQYITPFKTELHYAKHWVL